VIVVLEAVGRAARRVPGLPGGPPIVHSCGPRAAVAAPSRGMVLDSAAGGVLLCGALACAAMAARGDRSRAATVAFAAALACVAARELAAPADGTWLSVAAAALALAGIAALVVRRLGRPNRFSWLDAAMGASSVGALAVSVGAPPAAGVAAAGVAAGLGLSRWRVSPALLAALAGLALLGVEGPPAALAAIPLFAAAFLREPRAGPGPEFSPVVLTAILTFASISLTLLTLGQFVSLPPVAAVLAIVTVLAGMARAGLTVVQRLRESREQAITDDLTGLGNRRHLLSRLDESIAAAGASGTELALLLIDLDGFKELNDTLGHQAGDEVLRQIGPRLRHLLRDDDTLARLGGDEFAVMLNPGEEAAASVAGLRLRAALEQSFVVGGIRLHIDASVGIALFPEHGRDALGLLQRADIAMYEAKRARTGHEVYLPARDRHSRERLALVGELRGAIDAGQLVLHYQPKAELATGQVRGVEALVRWAHPRRGLLAPAEFLPIAEQSGLTRALTAFVIDRVLEEITEQRREGFDLGVAVNLGPADLLDLSLPSEIERLLHRRRFPPRQLRLEVSEDVVMADPERTLDVLAALRDIGVLTSLDDFGAGHASLGHLKQLRVDELKIDRSFVMRLLEDEKDAAIVHTTIDLGRRLGLRVVAEGVESFEAWARLAAWVCDEAQGHFLARPMPAGELTAWLARLDHEPADPADARPWAAIQRN
jgi:diguanylate cyclase (GGDEF)-like protein